METLNGFTDSVKMWVVVISKERHDQQWLIFILGMLQNLKYGHALAIVLPWSGLVRLFEDFAEPKTGLLVWFGQLLEHWTELHWTHSKGLVQVWQWPEPEPDILFTKRKGIGYQQHSQGGSRFGIPDTGMVGQLGGQGP
jgi:hypothetical protein